MLRGAVTSRILGVILFKTQVPRNTGAGGYGTELVNDVTWNEVNVIVSQLETGIANAITSKLVQLGFLHPLAALQGTKYM
jgi:hypothetical protein